MKKFIIASCLTVWAGAVLAGLRFANQDDYLEGAVQAAPSQWPASSTLKRRPRTASIVVAVHSGCPCTRSGVHELIRVVEQSKTPVDVFALIFSPPGSPESPPDIPGATLVNDPTGKELEAFGARVSGEAWYYDAAGNLEYHGGLTAARGHEGESAGSEALAALLANQRPRITKSPVFGCSLVDLAP